MSAVITTWTYDNYRYAVLGKDSAERLVVDFGLVGGDDRGLDEWLGQSEQAAWTEGGHTGDLRDYWHEFHARALAELIEAAGAVEVAS